MLYIYLVYTKLYICFTTTNIVTEDSKASKILPFYRLYTEAWPQILHIWISLGTKFQLKLRILVYWTKFAKKYFRPRTKKIEHHHWILSIWIRLGAKFQLKLTILSFWTKFAQKRYFQSEITEVNTAIEFCILEFLQMPNFDLNWKFSIFVPNLLNEHAVYISVIYQTIYMLYDNKYCNRGFKNFENITFLPIIYKRLTTIPKTEWVRKNVHGRKRQLIPISLTKVNVINFN